MPKKKDDENKIKIVDGDTRAYQTSQLTPLNLRSPEERRRIASMGGKKAAESRRAAKTFAEAISWALDLPAMKGNPTVDKLRKQFPELTNRDAIAISMTVEAVKKQNVRAFEAIRDTIGEAPTKSVDLSSGKIPTITIKTVD